MGVRPGVGGSMVIKYPRPSSAGTGWGGSSVTPSTPSPRSYHRAPAPPHPPCPCRLQSVAMLDQLGRALAEAKFYRSLAFLGVAGRELEDKWGDNGAGAAFFLEQEMTDAVTGARGVD